MSLILLKALFAGFLRNRHIARHFRRLAMLETVTDTSVSREVPPTLVAAGNSSAVQLLGTLGCRRCRCCTSCSCR